MSFVLAIITAAVFLAADQITKYIVITNMELGQSIDFIDGLLDFTYIHNDGGAWGIFGGSRWFLIAFTAVIMIALIILLIKNKTKSALFFWAGTLILSGGIGNMIDRLTLGYVIDFIEFAFVDFATFNIADSCVCVGAFIVGLAILLDLISEGKKMKKWESNEDNGTA